MCILTVSQLSVSNVTAFSNEIRVSYFQHRLAHQSPHLRLHVLEEGQLDFNKHIIELPSKYRALPHATDASIDQYRRKYYSISSATQDAGTYYMM